MKTVISKLNRFTPKILPPNALKPFDSRSTRSRPSTVKIFNQDFSQLIAAHGLTTSAVNDLLVLFRDHTDGLDLPLSQVDKTPFSSKVVTTNTIKTFIEPDPKDFTSDACRRECMVFRGMQLDPTPERRHLQTMVDCSLLLKCMHCHSPRFSRCAHRDCRKNNVPYENCSPFDGQGHSSRISMKGVYYRTMIGKLIQLYCLSQMEGFEDILKYDDLRIKKDGIIIDVLDGSEFVRQTRKMDENYKKVLDKFKAANQGQFLHQCSLLLTLSYDGVVNFKRKLDSMWPLLTSCVNCNPSHRAKMGTGMFLTMLHNAGIGSGIEKHMMDEMLVQELKKLERGVIFTILEQNGVAKKHVYLQARLLYTHLDTKALEKMGLLKLCNSLYGCTLCNLQTGSYRHTLHKCVFKDTRLPLDAHHVLRPAGQRQFTEEPYNRRNNEMGMSADDKQLYYFLGDKLYSRIIKAECEAATRVINLPVNRNCKELPVDWEDANATRFSLPMSTTVYNVWHHSDPRFHFDNFLGRVKYAFPDHRAPLIYQHASTHSYLTNGVIARNNTETHDELYRRYDANGRLKAKYRVKKGSKAKDCSYNGVHGISPLVEHLEAFNFPNFNFDMMHYMLNASNYFLKSYKGERGLQAGSRILEVSQETHTILKFKKLRPRWTITLAEQELADAIQNSILLPPQYKVDFSFKNPFRLRGFLKAREHMIFLMVFASFVLSFTAIGVEYIVFAAMFASDLCMLFNPLLVVADVMSKIVPCIYETRAVQEGLFPESEQVFIFHEVMDVVHHILKFGHVRGLMCFASERANGLISQSLTKGGVNYMQTMYNRYVLRENGCIMRFLDKPLAMYDNCGVYSDMTLKLYGESTSHRLLTQDCKNLFKVVFTFLETQELDNVLERSQFYRLYSAFKYMLQKKGSHTTVGFFGWFLKFSQVYNQRDEAGSRVNDFNSLKIFCTRFNLVVPLDDEPVSAFVEVQIGHVFETDVQFMMRFITSNSLIVESFKKIIVKGIRIDCRGLEFPAGSESDNLHTMWHSKRLYKSWFRCKHHHVDVVYDCNNVRTRVELSRSVDNSIRFGQMICAFRLNFPGEEFLHGLAIGNCHLRDAQYSPERFQHYVKPERGVCHDRYVCLNYIDSTAVAVCALNANSKVMFSSEDATSFTPLATATRDANCYAQPNDRVLHRLFLIPIHPERLSIEYGNIFDDLDHTRVWDNSLRLREEPGKAYVRGGFFSGECLLTFNCSHVSNCFSITAPK